MLSKHPAQCPDVERASTQADVCVLSSQACGLLAAPTRAHVHASGWDEGVGVNFRGRGHMYTYG